MPDISFDSLKQRFFKKSIPGDITKTESSAVFSQSKYLNRYYKRALENYYPELTSYDGDVRLLADHPVVGPLLKQIREEDERERRNKLALVEKDARQDFYKMRSNSVVVPVVGAGSIVAATATAFGTAAAGALGVGLMTFLFPVAAIAAVGIAGYLGYDFFIGRRAKERYAEDRTHKTALRFQLNQLYRDPIADPDVIAKVEKEHDAVRRRTKAVEIEGRFKQLHPKQSFQKLLLGATAGAAVGGFVFPFIGLALSPALTLVIGVLLGVALAAIVTEVHYRLQKHFFVKNEFQQASIEYTHEKGVTKGNNLEQKLENWLDDHLKEVNAWLGNHNKPQNDKSDSLPLHMVNSEDVWKNKVNDRRQYLSNTAAIAV